MALQCSTISTTTTYLVQRVGAIGTKLHRSLQWHWFVFSAPQLLDLPLPHWKDLTISLSRCSGIYYILCKSSCYLYQSRYLSCPGLLLQSPWRKQPQELWRTPGYMQAKEQGIWGWKVHVLPTQTAGCPLFPPAPCCSSRACQKLTGIQGQYSGLMLAEVRCQGHAKIDKLNPVKEIWLYVKGDFACGRFLFPAR